MTKFCNIHTYSIEPNRDTESLLSETCSQAVNFLQSTWQLTIPSCHVYITPKLETILLDEAPFFGEALNRLGFAIFRNRIDRLWSVSAGWHKRYRESSFIAIKPLNDFQSMNLENSLLLTPMNAKEKFCNVLVHELTHAATSHLNLPFWLNEGVALIAAENALGYGHVKWETLENLTSPQKRAGYFHLSKLSYQDLIRQYYEGYWLTRYLQEQYEGVLRKLLSTWKFKSAINRNVNKLFVNQTRNHTLYEYFKATYKPYS